VGLVFLLPVGPSGAAWAVAVGGAVSYIVMGLMAWRTLQQIDRNEISIMPDPEGDLPVADSAVT
jgi:Na+-driven multidrug efflux pump